MSSTKRIISTNEQEFNGRTKFNAKVVLTFDEFIINGTEGFLVRTTAHTVRPLAEGEIDRGLLSRMDYYDTKGSNYSNEMIDGLFHIVSKDILHETHSFPERIRELMSDALILAVCTENTFGLNNPTDWEFVTDEMLNPTPPPPIEE